MKQFQFTTQSGKRLRAWSFEKLAPELDAEVNAGLARLQVGDRFHITTGYWTRLPDLVDAEMEMAGQRAERLERIALEYLRILLPAHLNGVRLECSIAEVAVRNAKTLIAELDKQA